MEASSRLRNRDDVAVGQTVGARTVAGVLTVSDDYETVVERQPRPLQLRELVLAGVRHRPLVDSTLPVKRLSPNTRCDASTPPEAAGPRIRVSASTNTS